MSIRIMAGASPCAAGLRPLDAVVTERRAALVAGVMSLPLDTPEKTIVDKRAPNRAILPRLYAARAR
jgi:hypothetical protein